MGDLKPFCELSREEKLALLTAWVDGGSVQFKNAGTYWDTVKYPCWAPHGLYRVVPQKPSINWDHVDEKYNWLCIPSEKANPQLFEKRPHYTPDTWLVWEDGGKTSSAVGFSSLKVGNCAPEDSLVGRHDHD